MVNIAGRSRGCSTCRRRRVKCDESRPICKRCERCGLQCGGAKDIAFIHQQMTQKSQKSISAPETRDFNDDGLISIPASPNLKGSEIHTYICYTKKHLLRGGAVDLALQELELNDLHRAWECRNDANMLPRAIASLAVLFFGHQHKMPSIINRGYGIYGIVLEELNHALTDTKCYIHDEIVLSVITLVLLECFVPSGRKYYLKHMAGLQRLIELRGPEMNLSPQSFQTHKAIRRMILFASLHMRKQSILASEEWKAIPWVGNEDENLDEQQLLNILVDYSTLISESDKITKCGLVTEDVACQIDKVTRGSLDLLKQLQKWKKSWDNNDQNYHSEIINTDDGFEPPERRTHPFPTVFNFSSDSTATMLMLYNATLIFVLRMLVSTLASQSSNPLLDDSEQFNLHQRKTHSEYIVAERLAALEIFRCVPYFVSRKPSMDTSSLTTGDLAVRTARATLGGCSTLEGQWLMSIICTKDCEVVAKGLWVD